VEGESTCDTHTTNLANSSFDSLNCTLGEIGDAKYYQYGCSRQHGFSSQQTGYPTHGDVLRAGIPASHKPLVHDWGFDPAVTMLSVSNVKHRYMDENQFLE